MLLANPRVEMMASSSRLDLRLTPYHSPPPQEKWKLLISIFAPSVAGSGLLDQRWLRGKKIRLDEDEATPCPIRC
ncbi:uncharacterized [Tachysurus ichikawai]